MTDTMYVTRTYQGEGLWLYRMERSPNRTLVVNSSPGNYHSVTHTAKLLTRFKSGGGVEFRYSPKTVENLYSASSSDDFQIEYRVYDGVTMDEKRYCTVKF